MLYHLLLPFQKEMCILPYNMAFVEWGPKNKPSDGRRLLEVIRFSRTELVNIEQRAHAFLNAHPGDEDRKARAYTAESIATSPGELEHIHEALVILNQLWSKARRAVDVTSVVIWKDVNNIIRTEKGKTEKRTGDGTFFYYYDMDWTNPPFKKLTPLRPATKNPC